MYKCNKKSCKCETFKQVMIKYGNVRLNKYGGVIKNKYGDSISYDKIEYGNICCSECNSLVEKVGNSVNEVENEMWG